MTGLHRDRGRRKPLLLGAAAAVVAIAAASGILVSCGSGNDSGSATTGQSAPTRAASGPSTSAPAVASSPVARSSTSRHIYGVDAAPSKAAAVSPPVHVTVPSIGVSSGLQSLGLLPDGTLQSPSQWQVAGWYAKGVVPGEVGPAIIAGHVDSVSGPAVFFKLKQLKLGAKVFVTTRDHHTLTFVVGQIQEFPKNKFPTEAVYGPTPDPVLRLVTCTGDFDRSKRSYVDNLVVTASLS